MGSNNYATIAGYAIIFAAALHSGRGNANEYQFGSHAQAVYEQNTTRALFTIPRAGQTERLIALTSNANAPQIVDLSPPCQLWPSLRSGQTERLIPPTQNASAPQLVDLTPPSQFWPPQRAGQTPRLIASLTNANGPQVVDLTPPSWIWPSVRTPPAGVSPNIRPIFGAPQQVDLTIQAQIFDPQQLPQAPGPIRMILTAPQLVDLTIQAQYFEPQALPQAPGPIDQFFASPQYGDPTPTLQGDIWPSANKQGPSLQRQLSAAPQLVDLTQQGSIWGSQRTPPVFTGTTVTQFCAGPQADPTQIQPQLFGIPYPARGAVAPSEYQWGRHAEAIYEANVASSRSVWGPDWVQPNFRFGTGGNLYEFGLHAQAVYEQNVFSSRNVWGPDSFHAPTPQIASSSVYEYGLHAQAIYEYGATRVLFAVPVSPTQTGYINWELFGESQDDPTTIQGSIFKMPAGPLPLQPATSSNVYQWGSHKEIIYEHAVTRAIFSPPPTKSTRILTSVYEYGLHAQAMFEYGATRIIFQSVRTPPALAPITQILTKPQEDTTQQVRIWGPQQLAQGARVPPLWVSNSAAPQNVDLTVQGLIWDPFPGPAKPTVMPFVVPPQADTTQIPAQFFPSVRTPPIIPNPIAGFFTTLPQFEERVTQIVWPSKTAGQLPPRISQIFASPQADPSQLGTQFYAAKIGPPIIPNPVAAFFVTLPQFEERVTQVVWQSLRAGQLPPRIGPIFGAPQADPTQVPAQIFEPLISGTTTPRFLMAGPQLYDATQQALILNPINQRVPSCPLQLIVTVPQSVDLTIQGWVIGTAPGRFAKVPPIISGAPQLVDLTLQGWTHATAPGRQAGVPPLVQTAREPDISQDFRAIYFNSFEIIKPVNPAPTQLTVKCMQTKLTITVLVTKLKVS